jgi:hypothetical protein
MVDRTLQKPNPIRQVEAAADSETVTEFEATLSQVDQMPAPRVIELIKQLWCTKKDHAQSLLRWCVNPAASWKFLLFRNALKDMEDDSMKGQSMAGKPEAIQICIEIVRMYPVIIITQADSGPPTVLHVAATAQCPEVVEAIFQVAAELPSEHVPKFDALLGVEHRDETPLRMAVSNNMVEMVRHILRRSKQPIHDANILEPILSENRAGVLKKKIPVLKAIIQTRPEEMTVAVVKLALRLRDKGLIEAISEPKVCHRLFEDCGILHQAVEHGDIDLIDMLLKKFPKLVLELDEKKQSALSHNLNHKPELMEEIRKKIVRLTYRQVTAAEPSCYALGKSSLPISEIIRILIADPLRKS